MAQSLSKLYVHIIFHVKDSVINLRKEHQTELYSYIGAIIKDNESVPIVINGDEQHIHILSIMSKNIALAKFVEEIKRHSSRWIKTKGTFYTRFAWQGGYGGFSVSPSLYERTKRYIENQDLHHQKMSFKEEYVMFLREIGVEYDERYLWSG